MKTADHQEAHQPLGVAAIGLHPVGRGALDLPRRGHHAGDPALLERPRQAEAGRAAS
ncbi:MAG TPA: hypothetical protein VHV53_06585 [Solirubrobacterales bacterium]|jgi:hypothetical protein|nr:hypothetical protein [Solirubrobacterales bacterium]